jgi:hypothetical protein
MTVARDGENEMTEGGMEATSRVRADIYRGLDLPADWVKHPTDISAAIARDLAASVIAIFDAERTPLAACWCIAGGPQKFVVARSIDMVDDHLFDELVHDLEVLGEDVGSSTLPDLMVFAPGDVGVSQGQLIYKIRMTSRSSETEWNMAPHLIARHARDIGMASGIGGGLSPRASHPRTVTPAQAGAQSLGTRLSLTVALVL